jgi:hypothetical protein
MDIKHKQIVLNDKRVIDVYDDVFLFAEVIAYEKFIKNSLFTTTGFDRVGYKNTNSQINSKYSIEDFNHMGMLNSEGFQFLNAKHNLFNFNDSSDIQQIRVNLSTPAEANYAHTDFLNGKTFIYYACSEWEVQWGGHTLFLDEQLQDAEYACLYKPGRVVVFDGSIPHMIMTPSVLCPVNRFTFVIQKKLK